MLFGAQNRTGLPQSQANALKRSARRTYIEGEMVDMFKTKQCTLTGIKPVAIHPNLQSPRKITLPSWIRRTKLTLDQVAVVAAKSPMYFHFGFVESGCWIRCERVDFLLEPE